MDILTNKLSLDEFNEDFSEELCKKFAEEYYTPGKAVVFRQAFKNKFDNKKWDWEGMNAYFKAIKPNFHMRDIKDKTDYRLGKIVHNYVPMPADFIERYYYPSSPDYDKRHQYYVTVMNKGLIDQDDENNSLFEDLKNVMITDNIVRGPALWLGPKGHYEFNHSDAADNLIFMVTGKKRVRLFSNEHDNCLYYNLNQGYAIQSPVDLDDQESINAHPKIKDAPYYDIILDEGDMIYIPAFWAHQITSLTDSVSANYFMSFDQSKDEYWQRLTNERNFESFARHLFVNLIGCGFKRRVTELLEKLDDNEELPESVGKRNIVSAQELVKKYGSGKAVIDDQYAFDQELIKYHVIGAYRKTTPPLQGESITKDINRIIDHWKNSKELSDAYS